MKTVCFPYNYANPIHDRDLIKQKSFFLDLSLFLIQTYGKQSGGILPEGDSARREGDMGGRVGVRHLFDLIFPHFY